MLQVTDLQVRFGDRCVARIDDLSCASGEILGLGGESGSGKTVTASAILGLARRVGATVTGSIRVGDHEIVNASEQFLCRRIRGREVAMIFQAPASAFSPVLRLGDVF